MTRRFNIGDKVIKFKPSYFNNIFHKNHYVEYGIVTDADDNTIFVYEGEVNNKKNVTYAVELKGIKVVKGQESDYKNDKGESLVVTTSDDKEVPVDTTHVDDSSIFYLSSILASLKK